MKLIKKLTNVLLVMVLLFSEFAPYVVFANDISARPDTAEKGLIYNPQTGKVGTSASIVETFDLGNTNDAGNVDIRKTVTKVNEGEYEVKFEIRGNQVVSTNPITKPVYAVVVLDRSGSMKTCTNYNDWTGECKSYDYSKWNSAVDGAKSFATTLLSKISNANIALVTFSGTKDDECTKYEGYGYGRYCAEYGNKYNDASVLRDFSNANFSSVNFKSNDNDPTGGTNLEAGLKAAQDLLDGENVPNDAFKYVVVIGDGEPTFYYDNNGLTQGPGNVNNGSIETSINEATSKATSIKNTKGTNAKIYAIGYEVATNSTAERVLKGVASPTETLQDGTTKPYYFNADATAVGNALTNIANEINRSNAGKDATITDNLGGAFTLSNGSTATQVELKTNDITTEWAQVGSSFKIKINQDTKTGWYDTNAGFTLSYTDANGVKREDIKFNTNPSVYWVQNEYDYTVEYYYDNVKDSSLTETGKAHKNDTVTVTENGAKITFVKDGVTTITNKESIKEGYDFKQYNPSTGTLTIDNTNNIIKVYYEKRLLTYNVEHYVEDGNGYKLQETDENISIKYGETATFESNTYTGYTYVSSKTVYNQDDLVVEDNNLVIKLYYDKLEYSYSVEYYYDGVIDSSKTESGEAKYKDVINTYTDKVIPGYKLEKTENLPLTVTENASSNIIKVYYVKDEFNYTVEYYYDGVIDSNKTETKEATYQDIISTYTDKVIPGYKLEKTENLPLTVSEVEANNVIKVYYVKDEFNYTVEYYYDGTIDAEKTETTTATYQDVISTYTDKVIPGYKLEKTENLPLTVSEVEANNVIKVYYVKDKFSYTVEYYYDGTIDTSKTETTTATFQDIISTYTDKVILGYKLDKEVNLPLTVSEDESKNVIKIYYVKDKFNYVVEHYLENLDGTYSLDTTDRYDDVEFGSKADYELNSYTGYENNESLTKNGNTTVPANDELVIELYYDRAVCDYTVEYYYDNNIDNSKTETKTAKYGSIISDYTDKVVNGYHFVKDENKPLNITLDSDKNVIKVYYEKSEYSYTVEYYYDGVIDSSKTETKNAKFNDTINGYTDKVIPGYKLEKTENLPLTISEVEASNVIKVYYVKDEFNYTVEYYYDGVIDESKTETNIAVFEDVISTYTDKIITGYKLEKEENLPLTVSEVEANNVIKVYYVKDEFNYTVEYYYDGIIDLSKTETNTAKFNDTINGYTDKVITGYKLEKTENLPLTVSEVEANNVIKVYYVKDEFNYTVEYYYDGVIDTEKTETSTAVFEDVISTYTDKVILGYKLDKEENLPLTVSEVEANNVIRIYYIKDNFKYTVEYYYDGTIDETKTESSSATYQDVISSYTDKVIPGYKLEKEENLPLTVSEVEANNVIRIYYIKDNFKYTVEYYYDGVIDSSKTETNEVTYNDVIETYTDKVIPGYKLDKEENLPLTVSEIESNNVIRIYYVKDKFNYTVNHYLQNLEDDEYTLQETDNYTGIEYGSQATYELNVYEDYSYEKDEYVYDNNELTRNVLTEEEIITNKLVPANNNLVINVYYLRNTGKVTIHYVIKDVDDGSYIPFNVYGKDHEGNNTEDFIGLDLEDMIIEGKVGTEFNIQGRNPIEYTFVGLYEGALENNQLITTDTQEYNGTIDSELELTFVYQPPFGGPPQTGFEDNQPSYLVYILFTVMMTLTYTYVRNVKKED